MVAGVSFVAAWQQDVALQAALLNLPETLTRAAAADWSDALASLRDVDRLFVIGRGTGLPVAMEAALKFKETCGIQAEAFSGAEVRHGPMTLIDAGYPLLVLAPRGPAQAGLLSIAQEMRERGAQVLLAAPSGTPGGSLPIVETGSQELDPISVIQSFYPLVEALARERGMNPDQPRYLAKVTRTL
jgi:glucosamine--fructose-6-phosphate aminotransferase (isomerizing)